MNGSRISKLREGLGLGRAAFSRVLGTTPAGIWKWERDVVSPCGPSRKLLEYLESGMLKIDPQDFVLKRGRKRKEAR